MVAAAATISNWRLESPALRPRWGRSPRVGRLVCSAGQVQQRRISMVAIHDRPDGEVDSAAALVARAEEVLGSWSYLDEISQDR